MNFLKVLTFSLIIVATAAAKNNLGDLIPLCDPKTPNFNQCVIDSTNKLLPKLRNGQRGLDFPPLDPLKIPRMDIGQEGGAVFLKLTLSDTSHSGFSDLHVDSAQLDMTNFVWKFHGTIPLYSLRGDYVGHGKILVLPLGGEGIANFTHNDVGVVITVRSDKKTVNKQEYLDVKEANVIFEFAPGKNYINIKRTKGDLSTADHMSKFIRDNADEVLKGVKSSLEDVYSDIVTGLLRRFFDRVPYQQLFKQ